MSITYYEDDELFVPNVDDIDKYLWRKYEDKTLRYNLLKTNNLKLYGNHSDILMEFRDKLILHETPIDIPTNKYYYFYVGDRNIKQMSLKYRYKGNIKIYTYEKIEEKLDYISSGDDYVISIPIYDTTITKIYDVSFGDDYVICYDVETNDLFVITEKLDEKYIKLLEKFVN